MYKQKFSGIYLITNTVNGKQYIGSAVNILRRWDEHRCRLNEWSHANEHLHIFGSLDYGRHFNIDDPFYVLRSRVGL